jgi:hypothetical protein
VSESQPRMRRDWIWVFFEGALEEPIFHRFAPFIDQIAAGKVQRAEGTVAKTVLFLCEALATGVVDGKGIFSFFNALIEFKTDLDVRFSPLMETVIQEGWLGFTDGEPPFGAEGMDVIRAFSRTIVEGSDWYLLLAHPSVTVRYAMAETLADLGSSADIPRLERLGSDPDPGLRLRAEPLIRKIRIRESEDRIGAMLAYLLEPPRPKDGFLRGWILDQLVQIGDARALPVLKHVAQRDGEKEAEETILRIVERLRTEGKL